MIYVFAGFCLGIGILVKCYCLETKGKEDLEIFEEFRSLTLRGTMLSGRFGFKGNKIPDDDEIEENGSSEEKIKGEC